MNRLSLKATANNSTKAVEFQHPVALTWHPGTLNGTSGKYEVTLPNVRAGAYAPGALKCRLVGTTTEVAYTGSTVTVVNATKTLLLLFGNSLVFGQGATGGASAFANINNAGSWPDQLLGLINNSRYTVLAYGHSGADLDILQGDWNSYFLPKLQDTTYMAQFDRVVMVFQEIANDLPKEDSVGTRFRNFCVQFKTAGVTEVGVITGYAFSGADASNPKVTTINTALRANVGTTYDWVLDERTYAKFADGTAVATALASGDTQADYIHRTTIGNAPIAYGVAKALDLHTGVVGISEYAVGNTTPAAPGVVTDDTANTLQFTHALGVSEIVVSVNGGAFIAYTAVAGYNSGTAKIDIGNVAVSAGYYVAKIKAATGRNESATVSSGAFTVTSNTTPAAPTAVADDTANTLSFTHTLGTSEILVSINNGSYAAYAGPYTIGDVALAAGYYKAKIKSATGRNESAVTDSPAFTVAAGAAFVDIVFQDVAAATATGTEIHDNGGSQFSGVARSTQQLTASGAGPDDLRGSVRFKTVANPGFGGLAHVAPVSGSFSWPDDQLFFSGQNVALWRGNSQTASYGSFADTDLFQMDVYNGYVKIYKAGSSTPLITTSVAPVFPCWFSVVLQNGSSSAKFTDCQIKVLT